MVKFCSASIDGLNIQVENSDGRCQPTANVAVYYQQSLTASQPASDGKLYTRCTQPTGTMLNFI